ncbi:MAG: hypothetical protein F4110_07805 [Acidimicrobiaceae bacterium]|nr:hypothetical protein [Acidimicrobiaceae bacterium]MYI53868.1 hypothetical protein [Acidimicrobiaceae bacterium]
MFKNLISRFRQRGVKADPPPRRRDDSGLTTLEWLLIVAAVAGLAALAVVLVQNVVSDTSEQIEGSSARETAAQVAAAAIVAEASDPTESIERFGSGTAADWSEWERYYTQKCSRISITYADANIGIDLNEFNKNTGATPLVFDAATITYNDGSPSSTNSQVQCEVSTQ